MQPVDEIVNNSLQDKFLEALLKHDLPTFQELLNHPAIKPDHRYCMPHYSTCLEIACQQPNCQEFVKELLKRVKPNINQIVPEPIHYAAGQGNVETLKILLNDKRTKVNAQDSYGRTALHYAAYNFDEGDNSERYDQCIMLLLMQKGLDINRPNKKGCTAIYEAAYYSGKKAVLAMMKYGKQDLNLDSFCGVGKTARDIIIDKYPELKQILPPPQKDVIHPTEPHCQLLIAIQNKKVDRFRHLLQQVDMDGNVLMDPNEWYGKHYNTTCLEMACREEGCEEFVKAVLQAGAEPNTVNLINEQSPIHVAADMGNYESLKILLKDPRTNINAIDNKGRTALHCALDQREQNNVVIKECISLLLSHKQINVNIREENGHIPILKAVYAGNKDIVKCMLKLNSHSLVLDSIDQNSSHKTVRKIIIENFPELELKLPLPCEITIQEPTIELKLIQHLHKRQAKEFVDTFKKQVGSNHHSPFLNCNIGSFTFLQYACKYGLHEVANVLLKNGADPNKMSTRKWPPVVLACYHRHYSILKLFLNLKGELKFDINAKEMKGNTALHYAAKYQDLDSVVALLKNGADIRIKNVFDKPPLHPKTLKSLLNQCLKKDETLYPEEDGYKLIFNYELLVPQQRQIDDIISQDSNELMKLRDEEFCEERTKRDINLTAEMDFLFYLRESPDHWFLLNHPIVTSFLALKWKCIQKLFYFNIVLYATFFISLNTYILLEYEDNCNRNLTKGVHTVMRREFTQYASYILVPLLFLLLFCLMLKELVQLCMSPKHYVENYENILNIILIISTYCILYIHFESKDLSITVTVVTILLSWAELVLLTGRIPIFSENVQMLKTVSWTYFRFITWYSLVIMAFAISFYTMFHNSDVHPNNFSNFWASMFKTIVMMTGEFNSNDSIPFAEAQVTSHILFVLFMFLIAIILLNLLTGLAVSDTQAIKANAKLNSITSRIRLMYEIEKVFLQLYHTMIRIPHLKYFTVCFERWINHIIIFPLSDKSMFVLLNSGPKMILPLGKFSSNCNMNILAAAMKIIKNSPKTDTDLIMGQLEDIKMRLEDITKSIPQCSEIDK